MTIPTADEISTTCNAIMKKQAPQVGEIWETRSGARVEVINRDEPGSFLASIRVKFDNGNQKSLCLDGREAIGGWGSPADLMHNLEHYKGET